MNAYFFKKIFILKHEFYKQNANKDAEENENETQGKI